MVRTCLIPTVRTRAVELILSLDAGANIHAVDVLVLAVLVHAVSVLQIRVLVALLEAGGIGTGFGLEVTSFSRQYRPRDRDGDC